MTNENAQVHYSSIGNQLTVRVDVLKMLSGRDKATLFRALMEESGLLDKVRSKPDTKLERDLTSAYNTLWNQE